MKHLTQKLFIGALLISITSFAQTNQPCYSFDVIKAMDQRIPGYAAKVKKAFEDNKELLLHTTSYKTNADTLYNIPVVVHIVSTSSVPATNIDDSLVYSQIEVLNQDYGRTNPDTGNTRDEFKPIAGSLRFRFFLADTDPAGNPSTGIIRKVGTPGAFGFLPPLGFGGVGDEVKRDADGGSDPWPTNRYLNIWVCDIGIPGVLGYAFPPTGAMNWPAGSETDSASQGVVIDYTTFGRNNPNALAPEVGRGRSCTHEVGHYLGLRHIWADETACAEDDGIDDTPRQGDNSGQACNLSANTCTETGAVQFKDMIENYMDYSDERCQNMFSRQQADMMLLNLVTLRPDLAIKTQVGGVGINNVSESVFTVYPNPVSTSLRVSGSWKGEAKFSLYQINGRLISSNQSWEAGSDIDVSHLPIGLYILKVESEGRVSHGRFEVIR